jgi:RNA polymerase sigma-70 factor (ECF subfamily)
MALEGRPDEELVLALRDEGDEMAYETLLKRYQRPVYGYIRRQVKDPGLAEELAQETFLRVYDKIQSCQEPASFKAWTLSIAANLCRNQFRRQQVRRGENPDGQINGHAGPGPDPERSAIASQVARRIERALDQLTEPQREVFLLYQYTRLSYDEIAGALEVPVGTVKSRMNTALSRLRGLLFELKD